MTVHARTEPAQPRWLSILLAVVVGVAVNVAMWIVALGVIALQLRFEETCSYRTEGGWSWPSIYRVLLPLITIVLALWLPTLVARGWRRDGFAVGVLAALLPLWVLIETLPLVLVSPHRASTFCIF